MIAGADIAMVDQGFEDVLKQLSLLKVCVMMEEM